MNYGCRSAGTQSVIKTQAAGSHQYVEPWYKYTHKTLLQKRITFCCNLITDSSGVQHSPVWHYQENVHGNWYSSQKYMDTVVTYGRLMVPGHVTCDYQAQAEAVSVYYQPAGEAWGFASVIYPLFFDVIPSLPSRTQHWSVSLKLNLHIQLNICVLTSTWCVRHCSMHVRLHAGKTLLHNILRQPDTPPFTPPNSLRVFTAYINSREYSGEKWC